MRTCILIHFEYLHCAGLPPLELKERTRLSKSACVCFSLYVWTLMEDRESIVGLSPHTAGEQLWDGWSGETGSWVEISVRLCVLCLGVRECVCVCASVTIWLWPDIGPMPWARSLAVQLCIKQCSFRMTWWQYCGSSSRWPLWGAHLLTLGARQPPTLMSFGPLISTLPGSPRSRRHPPGARCAPHHCRQCVTFSAGGGGWGRRTKRRREGRNRGEQKEKTSGEIWLSTVVEAITQQAFLKHESPLMELGDKSYTCRLCICVRLCLSVFVCVRMCVSVCVPLQHMYWKRADLGLCPWLPSKVIYCT